MKYFVDVKVADLNSYNNFTTLKEATTYAQKIFDSVDKYLWGEFDRILVGHDSVTIASKFPEKFKKIDFKIGWTPGYYQFAKFTKKGLLFRMSLTTA